jgi:hypothetical protein
MSTRILKPWSDSDIKYLTDNKSLKLRVVANHLGRTQFAVAAKKSELGLTRGKKSSTQVTSSKRRGRISNREKLLSADQYIVISNTGARSFPLTEAKLNEMVTNGRIEVGSIIYKITPVYKVAKVVKSELAKF